MSSTSPLGQRSSAPEATSLLVFALASALLVYALTARSGEVRAQNAEPPSAETFAVPAELDAHVGDALEFSPLLDMTTRSGRGEIERAQN